MREQDRWQGICDDCRTIYVVKEKPTKSACRCGGTVTWKVRPMLRGDAIPEIEK